MSGLLTPQERAFVAAYARSGDPVEAARAAGYSAKSRASLRVAANRLLSRERVRAAVERERAKLRPGVSGGRREGEPGDGDREELDPLAELETIARHQGTRPSTRVRALELIAKLRRDRAQLEAEIAAATAARDAPDDGPTIVFVDNGRGPPNGPPGPTLQEIVQGVMNSPERESIVKELARVYAVCDYRWPEAKTT